MSRVLFNPKYILSLDEKYNFIPFSWSFSCLRGGEKREKDLLKFMMTCHEATSQMMMIIYFWTCRHKSVKGMVREEVTSGVSKQRKAPSPESAPGPCHTCTIGSIVLSNTSQGSHHVLNTALPVCYSLAGNWTRPVTLHSTDVNLLPLCSLIRISFAHINTKRHDLLRVRETYMQ